MSHIINPNNLPSLEDFIVLCNKHDWMYGYSDDHSVWTRGNLEREALLLCVNNGGAEYARVFKEIAQEPPRG